MTRAPLQPPRPLAPDDARAIGHASLRRCRELANGYDRDKRPTEADDLLTRLVELDTVSDPRDERLRIDAVVALARALDAAVDARVAAENAKPVAGGTEWRMGRTGVPL